MLQTNLHIQSTIIVEMTKNKAQHRLRTWPKGEGGQELKGITMATWQNHSCKSWSYVAWPWCDHCFKCFLGGMCFTWIQKNARYFLNKKHSKVIYFEGSLFATSVPRWMIVFSPPKSMIVLGVPPSCMTWHPSSRSAHTTCWNDQHRGHCKCDESDLCG